MKITTKLLNARKKLSWSLQTCWLSLKSTCIYDVLYKLEWYGSEKEIAA